jgi:flavin-dependent dehydrogenase
LARNVCKNFAFDPGTNERMIKSVNIGAAPSAKAAWATLGDATHDVVIVGGGLAGLTLAMQLQRTLPNLRIQVLERSSHPVPVAAHKVGESTVEIGAHYLAEVLGLREHLETDHLRKFGFRFFFSDGRSDIDRVTELGASRPLTVTTYQIDRGILENHLGQCVRSLGIEFVDEAMVKDIALAKPGQGELHEVRWGQRGQMHLSTARWVIDAGGRASILKRKLGLARTNDHAAHAVWFRVAHRIEVDRWSDDPAWAERCVKPERWMSTNHLCGPGYWVWTIPLASGSHSVGIVADPSLHPIESMNTFDSAMQWLAQHQPRLHAELDPQRDALQDFAFFKRFSFGCRQVFSSARWALTGEAGRFLDPFYSPGSDFIAIGNTYITKLVAEDFAGRSIDTAARLYDATFRSFYENMLPLYQGQYGVFGNAEVMPLKVLWDYTYYWSVLAPLFFGGHLDDLSLFARAAGDLATCNRLNLRMQAAFARHAAERGASHGDACMIDQSALPWFAALNRDLLMCSDHEGMRARLRHAAQAMQSIAQQLEDGMLAGQRARDIIGSIEVATFAHSPAEPSPAERHEASTSSIDSEFVTHPA